MPEIAALAEQLFGPGVAVVTVAIGSGEAPWPEEAAAVRRARPSRQSEFAAGRHAARAAMVRLGLPALPVPQAADRAPVWPAGLRGSISHDTDLAVAAVSRGGADLGLDIEPAQPLEPELWAEIALPGEIEALAPLPALSHGMAARLLFCAKEAAYKAWYPGAHEVIGFDAMRIEVAGDRVLAWPRAAREPLRGGWGMAEGRFVVAMRSVTGFKAGNTALIGPGPMARWRPEG